MDQHASLWRVRGKNETGQRAGALYWPGPLHVSKSQQVQIHSHGHYSQP